MGDHSGCTQPWIFIGHRNTELLNKREPFNYKAVARRRTQMRMIPISARLNRYAEITHKQVIRSNGNAVPSAQFVLF